MSGAATTSYKGVPKPDKVLSYDDGSNNANDSALFVFGDPSSSKMALLCAGFADDHTVFQPFAKALSESDVFVGVMCLPGFDDREDAPWKNHKPDGFTMDEMIQNVRAAAKTLRAASTYPHAEFTAMFHDWGSIIGGLWTSRLEEEVETTKAPDPCKPDKIVHFDVILSFHPKTENKPDVDSISPNETMKAYLSRRIYLYILAGAFLFQKYVSRFLAPFVFIPWFIFIGVVGLVPCYPFDDKSLMPLYGDRKPGIQRLLYMSYPYKNIFQTMVKRMGVSSLLGDPSKYMSKFYNHRDWRAMPILYLYGKKKPCMFHDKGILLLLEADEKEGRSLSKAVGIEDAGHFLYVQKQDECLKHILAFLRAENTFAKSS